MCPSPVRTATHAGPRKRGSPPTRTVPCVHGPLQHLHNVCRGAVGVAAPRRVRGPSTRSNLHARQLPWCQVRRTRCEHARLDGDGRHWPQPHDLLCCAVPTAIATGGMQFLFFSAHSIHGRPSLSSTRRCQHAFKFLLERGRPVVYGKEHDLSNQPWVGREDGTGWPIFLEDADVPTFAGLRPEPRTALQHFEEIETRARHFIRKWRGLLAAATGLSGEQGPAATTRLRTEGAVDWWENFLAEHKRTFPTGDMDPAGSALLVAEGGCGDSDAMLPVPHDGGPRVLGRIVQR